MHPSDTQNFFDVWDQCSEMYGKPPASDSAKAMAFKLLAGYSMADVKQALQMHMADPDGGQFLPKVADVVRKIRQYSTNQFPGAEQAWASFPRDEDQSACVCQEMLDAWGVASELDEIAGRMAFRESYNRAVSEAMAHNRKPHWIISPGRDQALREQATLEAVQKGLISPTYARVHLPHIPVSELQLLANSKTTTNTLTERYALTFAHPTFSEPEEDASMETVTKSLKQITSMLRMEH